MTTRPQPDRAVLVDEALATLERVREAWPWLAEVRLPGKGSPIERRMDPREEARANEAYRRDRAAALLSAKQGRTGAGPHADAGRVGPIAARAFVAHELRRLTERMLTAAAGGPVEFQVMDPASRRRTTRCAWCHGTGWLPPPAGWAWKWPAEPLQCPRCLGHCEAPAHTPCTVCGVLAACECDHADAVVHLALELLGDLIPGTVDNEAAMDALRVLERCDRAARNAASVAEDRRVIKAPCPACGRRELFAEVSSIDRSAWVIRCASYSCACAGAGCSCGRAVRWPGRRHLWPAREWDGPDGLAARLGVDLPGTARVLPRSRVLPT